MKLTKGEEEFLKNLILLKRERGDRDPLELYVKMECIEEIKKEMERRYKVKIEEIPEIRVTVIYFPPNFKRLKEFLNTPYVKDWRLPRWVYACD